MNINLPIILDGPMGTRLIKKGLPTGECSERWACNHPEYIEEIQKSYIDAGSKIISTPTFCANRAMLKKYNIENVKELNKKLATISKKIANGKALVAGDLSSTGHFLYPLGDMTFEEMYNIYIEQVSALNDSEVDLFYIETIANVAEARAASLAIKSICNKPIFVSFTCNENGKTVLGTDVCAALIIMSGMGVDAFGLNCSVGAKAMIPQIERLYEYSNIPLIAKPNILNSTYENNVSIEEFSNNIIELSNAGAEILGCCCGGDEKYIKAINEALKNCLINTSKKLKKNYKDSIICANEKDLFIFDKNKNIDCFINCDDNMDESLAYVEKNNIIGLKIQNENELNLFIENQYAINNPICLICDNENLLEKALRNYQGRALYRGNLPNNITNKLSNIYGMIKF